MLLPDSKDLTHKDGVVIGNHVRIHHRSNHEDMGHRDSWDFLDNITTINNNLKISVVVGHFFICTKTSNLISKLTHGYGSRYFWI